MSLYYGAADSNETNHGASNVAVNAIPGASAHHLSSATVSMLAIGGTIGTGLFFSVATLIKHGPLMALGAMCYIALIVLVVLEISGELAVFLPENGLICKYLFMFLSAPMGLANNLIYWVSWCLTYALELSIVVSLCGFWFEDWVETHQTLLILAVWALLTLFNLLPVDLYGDIEFAISLVKVVAIAGWIVAVSAILCFNGDVKNVWMAHLPTSLIGPDSAPATFVVNFVSCLVFASFVFQSVESVAITTGDVVEHEKTIPQVIRLVFVRIVVFYLLSVLLLTLLVPYDDPGLRLDSSTDLIASPFLLALQHCGFRQTGALLLAFNVVIVSAILSAANSNVYFGARCLEAMAETHQHHNKIARFFARSNGANVPVRAVLATSAFGLLALLLRFQSINAIFNFLLMCCALAGILMWTLLCFSHIRFRQALEAQAIPLSRLKHVSLWNLRVWAWFALINLVVILSCNGLTNLWEFSWLGLLGSYLTPLLFLVLWMLFQVGSSGFVPLAEVELWRGNLKVVDG